MPSKPGTLKIGSYLPAGEGSQVGAVRDESEHLREGKWRGEEGDAGGLRGPSGLSSAAMQGSRVQGKKRSCLPFAPKNLEQHSLCLGVH